MKSHLTRMIRSMGWADRRSLAALRSCPEAQGEGLPLLAHVLAAEHVWLSRLEGRDARIPVRPILTLDECAALAAENEAGFLAYLGRATDDSLAALLRYRNTQGEEFVTPVIDILTHVVIHGAYHRGQVARALGRAGTPAVSTDFIIFAREVEPA